MANPVQQGTAVYNVDAPQVLTINGVTAGNSLIVIVGRTSSAGRDYTVVSNIDGALTKVADSLSVITSFPQYIFVLHNASAGNHTITITQITGSALTLQATVLEAENLSGASPVTSAFLGPSASNTHYCAQVGEVDTAGATFMVTSSHLNGTTSGISPGSGWALFPTLGSSSRSGWQYRESTGAESDQRGQYTNAGTARIETGCMAAFPVASYGPPVDETYTVGQGAGQDYASLQDALADLGDTTLHPPGSTVTLLLDSASTYTIGDADLYVHEDDFTNLDAVTIRAAPGHEHGGVIGAGVVIDCTGGDPVWIHGAGILIEDVEFDGGGNTFGAMVWVDFGTLRRCIVHNMVFTATTGIPVTVVNGTLDSCIVRNATYTNASTSLRACVSLDGGEILNCVIDTVINSLSSGGFFGLRIINPSTEAVQNTVITNVDDNCFERDAGGTPTLVGIATDDGTADDFGGSGHIVNLVRADAFVDPGNGDYRPKVGSALIDAGVDLGTGTDIAGEDRDTHGTSWDIGAFEYVALGGSTYDEELTLGLSASASPQRTIDLSGQVALGVSGGVSPQRTIDLTGQVTLGLSGDASLQRTVDLSGQVSLGVSAEASPQRTVDLAGQVSLGVSGDVSLQRTVDLAGAVTLGLSGGITDAASASMFNQIALAAAIAATPSANSVIGAAISLAGTLSVAEYGALDIGTLVTVGLQGGMTASGGSAFFADAAVASSLGVSVSSAIELSGLVALAVAKSLTPSANQAFLGAITLGSTLGSTQQAVATLLGGVTLASGHTLSPASNAVSNLALSLPVLLDVSQSGGSAFAETLSLDAQVALAASIGSMYSALVSIAAQMGVVSSSSSALSATAQAGLLAGISSSAQSEMGAQLAIQLATDVTAQARQVHETLLSIGVAPSAAASAAQAFAASLVAGIVATLEAAPGSLITYTAISAAADALSGYDVSSAALQGYGTKDSALSEYRGSADTLG